MITDELELITKAMHEKLTDDEYLLCQRIKYADFLNMLREKMPSAIIDLLIFSGSFEPEEEMRVETWHYYSSIDDCIDDDIIRILSLRLANNKTFQDYFFNKFLPIYPNVKRFMDYCIANELTLENLLIKSTSVLTQLLKKAKSLSREEYTLLEIYSTYIDPEHKYAFYIPTETYDEILEEQKENFLYALNNENFLEMLEDTNVDEKLKNNKNFWDDMAAEYTHRRMVFLSDYYGENLKNIFIKKFLMPEELEMSNDINVSNLLYRYGFPDVSFFNEKNLEAWWNEDKLLGLIFTYYKDRFYDNVLSFNDKEGFKDTSITKYTLKKYIFPIENDMDPKRDVQEMLTYLIIDILLNSIAFLRSNLNIRISKEIVEKSDNTDATRKLEYLEQKNVSLKEMAHFYETENTLLKNQLKEQTSKKQKDKSFINETFEKNKVLQSQIEENNKTIEELQQKLVQYEEYLQATEQNEDIDTSEVKQDVLDKWFAEKKIMFFTHEAGEYINNLKKEFPDCIIVDNETQALDGVKADITVAMTKCMSHKLFFKQKSYAVATGAEIVYYNQRNIDNLKPVIYKQIFKK